MSNLNLNINNIFWKKPVYETKRLKITLLQGCNLFSREESKRIEKLQCGITIQEVPSNKIIKKIDSDYKDLNLDGSIIWNEAFEVEIERNQFLIQFELFVKTYWSRALISQGTSHSITWGNESLVPIDFWTPIQSVSGNQVAFQTDPDMKTGEIRVQIEKILNKSELESINHEIEDRIRRICDQPVGYSAPKQDMLDLDSSSEISAPLQPPLQATNYEEAEKLFGGYDLELVTDQNNNNNNNDNNNNNHDDNNNNNHNDNNNNHKNNNNNHNNNNNNHNNNNNNHNNNMKNRNNYNVINNSEKKKIYEKNTKMKQNGHNNEEHNEATQEISNSQSFRNPYPMEIDDDNDTQAYDPELILEKMKMYACHDDLEVYNYYEGTKQFEPKRLAPPTFRKKHLSLNERFQMATQSIRQFRASVTSSNEKIQVNMELIHLYQDFLYSARLYGKIIISERSKLSF